MYLDFFAILLLLAGCFVSWNTGANDAANCIGATVGAGIIKFKYAVLMMAIFVFLGAVFEGKYVMDTTGSGIVITTDENYLDNNNEDGAELLNKYFPDRRLPDMAIFVALLSAGISVTIATYLSIPLSTSQSIVGSVAGVGIGIVGFQSNFFRLNVLYNIFGSWIISPFLTLIIAYLIYQLLIIISIKIKNLIYWEKFLSFLVVVSSCYFSYTLGSNAFGSGLGPLLVRFPGKEIILAIIGGIALGIGAMTFGHKVTETVGKKITKLDFAGAFAAQFAAGLGLQFFSHFGIPVSSSQAIVGAVVGVGLVKGSKMVDNKRIIKICVGWFVTPTFAAAVAIILYRLLSSVFF